MKENLIKRIITGFFLVIGAIAWMFIGSVYLVPIFGTNPEWSAYSFMSINTFLLIMAVYEIIKLRRSLKWSIWIKLLIFLMAVILFWLPFGNENFGPYIYNSQWFSFWITLVIWIFFITIFIIIRLTVKNFTSNDLIFVLFWTFYLVLVFKGINLLMLYSQGFRHLGWATFVFIWVIVLSNDIGAYFGGMLLGKKWKKLLAPRISPKKTWVGAISGFIISVVLSMIVVTLLLEVGKEPGFHPLPIYEGTIGKAPIYIAYLGIACILSFISQVGDLLFSLLKREHNVKDFSNIFPGHGGLLDRLDGFSLVVLVTYSLTLLLFSVI